MQQNEQPHPQKDRSSEDLAANVLRDARSFVKAELAVVEDDLLRSAARAARSAIAFGIAGVAALAGIQALVLSAGLAGRRVRPSRSAAAGLGLFAVAAAAALVGRAALPRNPLPRAASRVASDVEDVARRAAA
ncbi:Hypothetical protein A7982_01195 [Minicystis rosea]|nr:Hypothetical protein A7982_01195 [Minicystis rosea]